MLTRFPGQESDSLILRLLAIYVLRADDVGMAVRSSLVSVSVRREAGAIGVDCKGCLQRAESLVFPTNGVFTYCLGINSILL